jgi:hypothetical protein
LHRVEVLLGVERHVGKNKGIGRVIVEHHGPGAAIRRRFCDRRSADASAPARPVLDNDGRAEPLLHVRLNQARDHVGRSAWRVHHDDLDIACGPVLGMSGQWDDQRAEKQVPSGKHAHEYAP